MARAKTVWLAGLTSAALLTAAPVMAQPLVAWTQDNQPPTASFQAPQPQAAQPTAVEGLVVQGAGSAVCCRVPEGAEVAVQLSDPIDTRHAKAGDLFNLRLAAPLIIDGQIVLPEGVAGIGRVVQSSGPGIGGKGAKLVVSAEYLTVPGGAVKLKGMQLTGSGKDRSMAANVLGAGGIAFAPIGVLGIALTGGDIAIPAGVAAGAKIAEAVTLPPVAAATGRDYARIQAVFGAPQESRGWLDIPPPPQGMGQVVFFRRKTMTGIQWFNVREHGEALGKLTTGTYFIAPVQPGLHEFTARSEPELNDHLTLKVDPGETYYVESVMTHGLVLGAAELTPSDKARFDALSGDLKPAEVKTAAR